MADLLIIDDDPDGAEALRDIMKAKGHEVRVGYNRDSNVSGSSAATTVGADDELSSRRRSRWS